MQLRRFDGWVAGRSAGVHFVRLCQLDVSRDYAPGNVDDDGITTFTSRDQSSDQSIETSIAHLPGLSGLT